MHTRRVLFTALVTVALLGAPLRADDFSGGEPALPARDSVNFKLYPLPAFLRIFALDVDFGVWRSGTVGASIMSIRIQDPAQNIEAHFSTFTIRTNITLGRPRFTDAWFISPMIGGGEFTLSGATRAGSENIDVSAKVKASLTGLFFGHQWFWSSGFNLSLGVGVYAVTVRPEITLRGESASTGQAAELPVNLPEGAKGGVPWVELGLGWVF